MSRILKCNGSAQEGLPDDPSEAADRGTSLHDVTRRCLEGERVTLLPEDAEHVRQCTEYVRGQPDRFQRYYELLMEHGSIKDFGGTSDVVLLSDTELEVIDFKFGDWPVDAEDNKQMLSYLLLARDKFGPRANYAYHIVQPAVGLPVRVPVTVEQLNDHALDVIRASYGAGFTAGEHCRWCPLLATCETARHYVVGAGKTVFDESTTIGQYLEVLEAAPVMVSLVGIAKKELLKLALAGEMIPGYRVGKSLTDREWTSEQAVEDEFGEIAWVETMRSPAQLEARLKELGQKPKQYQDRVGGLTERRLKGPILVKENSRTPAWEFVTGDVFLESESG
jgi:hypothetical protein